MTTTVEPMTLMRQPCGFCKAGLHYLCPDAVWNPGGGKKATVNSAPEGEALYCPCDDRSHEGVTARCRDCGERPPADELGRELTCLDSAACALRVAARLENDPIHQLILECQTTRIVGGEITERPRRATPEQVRARREAKAAAVAKGCTCGCGGTTKGGAFLPGHDARYLGLLAGAVRVAEESSPELANGARIKGRKALSPFPKLLAKFEKRIGS